jgi:hypothetical protein
VGDAARDREAAKNVQCSLEYTTLKRVTEATEIYYDPIPDVRIATILPARDLLRSSAQLLSKWLYLRCQRAGLC